MPTFNVIPVAMLTLVVGSKVVSHLFDAALTKMVVCEWLSVSIHDLLRPVEQTALIPVPASAGPPSCAANIAKLCTAVTTSCVRCSAFALGLSLCTYVMW